MCLHFQKSTDMLNKNPLGVKKVRGQSEAALQIGQEITYQKSTCQMNDTIVYSILSQL